MPVGKTVSAPVDTCTLAIQATVDSVATAIQACGPVRMSVASSPLGTTIQATVDPVALLVQMSFNAIATAFHVFAQGGVSQRRSAQHQAAQQAKYGKGFDFHFSHSCVIWVNRVLLYPV